MSKTLDSGEKKIQKICDALRKETLEPAKKEAEEMLKEAKRHAEQIVAEARKDAEEIIIQAKDSLDRNRELFESSLSQGTRLALDSLRQSIENELFCDQLGKILEEQTSDPQTIANLIRAIIAAVENEGLATDISAVIPRSVSPEAVNALLGEKIIKILKGNSIVLGEFNGGAQVKLDRKQITLDITEETLRELLATFIRKDFRKLIFKS